MAIPRWRVMAGDGGRWRARSQAKKKEASDRCNRSRCDKSRSHAALSPKMIDPNSQKCISVRAHD
ncbi:uncharacterized protein BO66DRAFT_7476 [Aspergillus aculeatinus CBS 121060]|uniref:Uncharacterized protein n=1 Tax=Aspergillus aculeatinus CBS 121060 TaxID=1448322 RepID=A0ACD1HPD1_9EURO|nr:hypothetical protein BO66DRAFT_7476 [Aspergillus aculeatinus CBS 121060]RAH75381.1 hypothetical protein BO66DRAFT_7476 [Aspergillus aculeatinus CBS 121060]